MEAVEKYLRVSLSIFGNPRGLREQKTSFSVDFVIPTPATNIDTFLGIYGNLTLNELIEKSKEANLYG